MDLGTVLTKLLTCEYDRYIDVFREIDLIWENCMIYNKKGSIGCIEGTKMMRVSNLLLKNFKDKYEIEDD